MRQRNQSGFSLFEITFVIVLTCLLATIMVIGQNFTARSKVDRLKQDFNSLQTVLYEIQISLNPKHGNLLKASLHAPNATTAGNKINHANVFGNWKSVSGEIFHLWQNSRPADPANVSTNSNTYVPLALSGAPSGMSKIVQAPIAGLISNYIICTNNINGKLVKQLDLVMDDGNTASGFMLASKTFGSTAIATGSIITGSTYMVCLGVK